MKQFLQKGIKTRHKSFLGHINKKKKKKSGNRPVCFKNRKKTEDNLTMAQKLYVSVDQFLAEELCKAKGSRQDSQQQECKWPPSKSLTAKFMESA